MSENPYHDLLETILAQSKSIKIAVRGMSMFPMLLTNDVVLVKPIEADDLKFGQIVVFRLGDNLVVHRLIGQSKEKGLVFTRGDGLPKKDKSIKLEDVIGVVVGIEQSRWSLAKLAIGPWSPVWAVVMPVISPFVRDRKSVV